jgi:excisionase family DNA binding protein
MEGMGKKPRRRRSFTPEFKAEIVELCQRGDRSVGQAATMLGLSRPTLMKLLESGEIAHVKVGTHHRVPAQAILEYQRARRARREKAAEALAVFSNETGFVD